MGVVCKEEILSRLSASVDNKKQLVITPLLNRKEVFRPGSDVDSIDLRLGNSFLLP